MGRVLGGLGAWRGWCPGEWAWAGGGEPKWLPGRSGWAPGLELAVPSFEHGAERGPSPLMWAHPTCMVSGWALVSLAGCGAWGCCDGHSPRLWLS